MRGEVFVIGGEPGVGKSRAATALAVAGALGGTARGAGSACPSGAIPHHDHPDREWPLPAAAGIRRARLRRALHGWVRVSEPPPFGITLGNSEFLEDIRAAIAEFQPRLRDPRPLERRREGRQAARLRRDLHRPAQHAPHRRATSPPSASSPTPASRSRMNSAPAAPASCNRSPAATCSPASRAASSS